MSLHPDLEWLSLNTTTATYADHKRKVEIIERANEALLPVTIDHEPSTLEQFRQWWNGNFCKGHEQ